MAAASPIMVKPCAWSAPSDSIRIRSQSLIAGVAFMYCGDSPRMNPIFQYVHGGLNVGALVLKNVRMDCCAWYMSVLVLRWTMRCRRSPPRT